MNNEQLLKRYQKILLELVYSSEEREIRNSYQDWVDLSEEIEDLRELFELARREIKP